MKEYCWRIAGIFERRVVIWQFIYTTSTLFCSQVAYGNYPFSPNRSFNCLCFSIFYVWSIYWYTLSRITEKLTDSRETTEYQKPFIEVPTLHAAIIGMNWEHAAVTILGKVLWCFRVERLSRVTFCNPVSLYLMRYCDLCWQVQHFLWSIVCAIFGNTIFIFTS
jgi:hypothetical protein